MWLPFRLPPRYRNWFIEFTVHRHARPLYVPHCCTGALLHTRQTRYMYALKAPTCPRDKDVFNLPLSKLQRTFAAVLHCISYTRCLLHAWRSPVDCCDPCQFKFPYWALFWDRFWEQFWAPFLGATIRIERTGAKTEAKTGPKSGPKSGTNFAKLFADFFGHAPNRCPQWSCPSFSTFAFFLFARILARILQQPIQAKLAATGKRTRASVSKPNLCPQQ